MDFITDFLAIVGAWLSGILELVTSAFGGAIGIFYDSTAKTMTTLGVLLLFALAASLVWMGINFIIGLVKKAR